MILFQRSFQVDDTNPLTMKHLADHFFFDNDYELAEALCTRALKFTGRLKKPETAELPSFRSEIELLSSDLNFILGKVHHAQDSYEDALRYYFQAVQLNKQNYAAQFCLAKLHFLNGNFNAVDECLNLVLSHPRYKDCYEALRLLAKVKSL